MNRILSFDACRFILALCVVFGHTYINLFRQGKETLIGVQNLAVDGFFILSGFLIALSVTKHTRPALDASAQFISSTCRRFRRLWPEYFFALVVVFVLGWVFLGKYDGYAIPFNLIFLSQINKFPGVINGSWYVSVLFFGGALVEYLLITKRQKAVYFWFPLIIFLLFSYICARYAHLSVNANPMLGNIYSVGLLKGILDMSIGIECYYAAQYISQTDFNFRPWFSKIIPYLWELLGLFFVLYAWASKGINRNNFLVLFGYVILIILLSLKKEHILKFLSWKPWQLVAPLPYMIFLTHVVLLEIIKKYVNYQAYPQAIVYLSTLALAVSLGGLCYHAQKWCFAHLKSALFISRD